MFRNKNAIGWAITVVGLSMSAFHLAIAWFGPPDALTLRAAHLGFALVLAFLMLPVTRRKSKRQSRKSRYLLSQTRTLPQMLPYLKSYLVPTGEYWKKLNPKSMSVL